MKNLYKKFRLRDGRKVYVPTIAGKRRRLYKRASEAQAHSEKVWARYQRLKAAAA